MTKEVATRSEASEYILNKTLKIRALYAGTDTMRAANETYLTKNPSESDKKYDARLAASWLFNGVRKTVRDMTGRVFDKPIKLGEDVPPTLVDWMENADLEGRDLSTFSADLFRLGLMDGISWIMVDAPSRDGELTKGAVADQNIRPSLTILTIEDVLGWKITNIKGAAVLSQIRIIESVDETDPDDEFAVIPVTQVRVMDLIDGSVQVRIYRKVQDSDEWELLDEPATIDMDAITVVPFYSNRTGYFTGEPLLDDLADVNIAHWQAQSMQTSALATASTPILFGSGVPDGEEIKVSASTALTSSDPDAKLQWVETKGFALKAGVENLLNLENKMEAYGLQLLVQKAANQSATGEALDANKETTQLSMIADNLQDALEISLGYMAEYGGLGEGGSVEVNKEFGAGAITSQELQTLLADVTNGITTQKTYLSELQRRGVYSETLDVDKEIDDTQGEGSGMPEDDVEDEAENDSNVIDFTEGLKDALNG